MKPNNSLTAALSKIMALPVSGFGPRKPAAGELTLDAIRDAAQSGGRNEDGRKALFPDKRPGLVYLTPATKARLVNLAKNARVSQADFLEVLIRRYGLKAGNDILTALGEDYGSESSAT